MLPTLFASVKPYAGISFGIAVIAVMIGRDYLPFNDRAGSDSSFLPIHFKRYFVCGFFSNKRKEYESIFTEAVER